MEIDHCGSFFSSTSFYNEAEIYIPKCGEKKLGWGERNGARAELKERNRIIIHHYLTGFSIEELMDKFHLSYDSIRKIVRGSRKKHLGTRKGT